MMMQSMIKADIVCDGLDIVDVKVPAAKRTRVGKPKVKTGCTTCKIRRIKCDETKPSCKRCTSTGRTCDGYAPPPPSNPKTSLPKASSHLSPSTLSPNLWNGLLDYQGTHLEHRYLSFFQHQTAPILSGCFDSYFWTSLILQVGNAEPTIQHAMMAVASIHEQVEAAGTESCNPSPHGHGLDRGRYFALQQYNKAISCLNRRLAASPSEEVTLICCVLFIALEFLRGNVDIAITHLHAGLGILAAWKARSRMMLLDPLAAAATVAEPHSVPENLALMFSRLSIQSMLCDRPPPVGRPRPEISLADVVVLTPAVFPSLQAARTALDSLMKIALEFLREAHSLDYNLPTEAEGRMRDIMNALEKWGSAFDLFLLRSAHGRTPQEVRAAANLQILNIVAKVWLFSAQSPDESVFDEQTSDFSFIISLAKKMDENRAAKSSEASAKAEMRVKTPAATFAFEMGIIPPLFFVAMKCRVPSIRRSALALLETTMPRREGVWIADLYVAVARRIIQIEEQGLTLDGRIDHVTGEKLPLESKCVRDTIFHSRAEEDLVQRVQRVTFVMRPDGVGGELECKEEAVFW